MVMWLFLASLIVTVLTWAFMKMDHPDFRTNKLSLDGIVNKFLFIFPAVVLAGIAKNILLVWLLYVLSVFATLYLLGIDWSYIVRALDGRRTGLIGSPIGFGVQWATMFVAALCFSMRAMKPGPLRIFRILIWLFVLVFSAIGTLISQTRSVYLSLAIVALIFLLVFLIFLIQSNRSLIHKILIYCVVLCSFVLLAYVSINSKQVERRIQATQNEIYVVDQFLSGNRSEIDQTSMGFRFIFWHESFQRIKERPLFGWGYRASRVFFEESKFRFGSRYFYTSHNLYIDLTLYYGFAGLSIFIILFFWLMAKGFKAYQHGTMPADFALFFLGFAVIYSVNGLFSSMFFTKSTMLVFNIVLSGWLSFVFKDMLLKSKP